MKKLLTLKIIAVALAALYGAATLASCGENPRNINVRLRNLTTGEEQVSRVWDLVDGGDVHVGDTVRYYAVNKVYTSAYYAKGVIVGIDRLK